MKTKAGASRQAWRTPFRARPLHALLLLALACWQVDMQASPTQRATPASAGTEFDSRFVHGAKDIDISRFTHGNVTEPGLYVPDIYVNGNWIGRTEVRFEAARTGAGAQACVDRTLLERTGIDITQLPEDGMDEAHSASAACLHLEQRVPGASTRFDTATQKLELSIPQVLMLRVARGHVDPGQWSVGVPAALLGYNFNTYHSRNRTGGGTRGDRGNSTQSYLGLDSGFNYQRWHLRHNGSLSWDGGGRRYQNVATYVQRDIADWSSHLILGESYTDGELMESVAFRGLRLRTDDRMLPESQRGFAPVVRGVAQSNARVTVHQNGNKLYEATVAPGAFVIDDLFPTGYGGDLRVEVTEADGSVHSFSVPYAAMPRSLREGHQRYSLTAGAMRNLPHSAPLFMQASWQYGLSNMVTAHGGATLARGYASPTVGAVLNTPWGAFGMDITHATTRIPGKPSHSGRGLKVNYAKTFAATGTNAALAAYRYSTKGLFNLGDAMRSIELAQAGSPAGTWQRPRIQISLILGQQLGLTAGHFSLSASTARYARRNGSHVNYSANYSNVWRGIPYNLLVSRQRDAWGRSSTQLYAAVTIPMGNGWPSISNRLSHGLGGRSQIQASTHGHVSSDFSYALNTEYGTDAGGSRMHGSANATYRRPFAQLSGSVGAGRATQQLSLGARGAVVAHPGGITLSQPVSETFGIVKAEHAQGAQIVNAPGVRIDARGYAIVPHLAPYAMNEVSIDPQGISMDVELLETSRHVAPLAGGSPMMVFRTDYSRSAVIRTWQSDGSPVPFGAIVSDDGGKSLGVVGMAGKLLVRGLADKGRLQVRWKAGDDAMVCSMSYALPQRERHTGYQAPPSLDLPCVSPAGDGKIAPAAPPEQAPVAAPAPSMEQQPHGPQPSTSIQTQHPKEQAQATQAQVH